MGGWEGMTPSLELRIGVELNNRVSILTTDQIRVWKDEAGEEVAFRIEADAELEADGHIRAPPETTPYGSKHHNLYHHDQP